MRRGLGGAVPGLATLGLALPGLAVHAAAAPLALYDTAREATPIAPIAPAQPCGGFAVACSEAPVAAKPALPFDYGLAVSGVVAGSSHGGFGGGGVSGWVKPKDLPVTLYFDIERLQALGSRR